MQDTLEHDEDPDDEEAAAEAAIERSRKRRRLQQEAIADIKSKKGKDKKMKAKGKRKSKNDGGDGDDSDDSDYDDDLGRDMYKKSVKLPGQLENCEICDQRFTVTPYSKAGPDGGLLCTPCGKQLTAEAGESSKPKKRAGGSGRKRRKIESEKLDGRVPIGAKALAQLCIEKVVKHTEDIEDFGDLPQNLLERLSQIFTKKRVMKPKTLPLFLRPENNTVVSHDCAYLEHNNFVEMIAKTPNLQRLVLGNACQFKGKTMEYLTDKAEKLECLQLYAANLVFNAQWSAFFKIRGENLRTLKLRLGGSLEHLSLQLSNPVSNEALIALLHEIGHPLQTLSLRSFSEADDSVLAVIKSCCNSLRKLRLTDNANFTDAGLAHLFTDWTNPPLSYIDFTSVRDVDNSNADGPADRPMGVASTAFEAMMRHSGARLEHINVSSCRHISHETLATVFSGEIQYPELKEIDVSFVGSVDTMVLAGLFKAAPKLRRVVAFGCFAIEDLVVPAGVVVIGVPKAQDAIEKVGGEVDVEEALASMAALMEEMDGDRDLPSSGRPMQVDVMA